MEQYWALKTTGLLGETQWQWPDKEGWMQTHGTKVHYKKHGIFLKEQRFHHK